MARIKYVINERRLLYEKYATELESKRQVPASKAAPEVQPSHEKKGRVSRAERLKARRTGRSVAPVTV